MINMLEHRWLRRLLPCLLLTGSGVLTMYASADTTLTLRLPPSKASLEAIAQTKRQEAAKAYQANKQASALNRGSLAYRGMSRRSRSENVVGRLGQMLIPGAIYREPDYRSDKLSRLTPGTYVAVTRSDQKWVAVLMSDQSTGWIPSSHIKILDYQVTSPNPIIQSSNHSDTFPHTNQLFFTGNPQSLIQEAYKYLGVPYVWGGTHRTGLDCSGFVQKVFDAVGFHLPRTAEEQASEGVPVQVDQLQPGDRLYFEPGATPPYIRHTGIYIGNGYFIHSSVSGHGVAVNSLNEGQWLKIFICARR